MIIKIKTSDMSRADWLSERRKSIGGSEIGAILGLNKYASAYLERVLLSWLGNRGRVFNRKPDAKMEDR